MEKKKNNVNFHQTHLQNSKVPLTLQNLMLSQPFHSLVSEKISLINIKDNVSLCISPQLYNIVHFDNKLSWFYL